jgi:hypothetical protein
VANEGVGEMEGFQFSMVAAHSLPGGMSHAIGGQA